MASRGIVGDTLANYVYVPSHHKGEKRRPKEKITLYIICVRQKGNDKARRKETKARSIDGQTRHGVLNGKVLRDENGTNASLYRGYSTYPPYHAKLPSTRIFSLD